MKPKGISRALLILSATSGCLAIALYPEHVTFARQNTPLIITIAQLSASNPIFIACSIVDLFLKLKFNIYFFFQCFSTAPAINTADKTVKI